MSDSSPLFRPLKIGTKTLKHRIILAPLTRMRADANLVPTKTVEEYYEQRTTPGGLLISEATNISPEALGYANTPGIWTSEQVEGWKKVVSTVHAKGGLISCQLWHAGRQSHTSFTGHDMVKDSGYTTCWSSSEDPHKGTCTDFTGETVPHSAPKAHNTDQLRRLRHDFVTAAKNAIAAGFDFVEIHGAHGYIIHQYLSSGSNTRRDTYGQSLDNRLRLLDEVLGDIIAAIGKERASIRISPHFRGMEDYGCPEANPEETFARAMDIIRKHEPAYVFFTEPRWDPSYQGDVEDDQLLTYPAVIGMKYSKIFQDCDTKVIGGGGFTPISGRDCVQEGIYDAIAFGRWFIANPDFVLRIRYDLPLTKYQRETFYQWKGFTQNVAKIGYTDYPTFKQLCSALGVGTHLTEEEFAKNRMLVKNIVEKSKGTKYELVDIETLGTNTSINKISLPTSRLGSTLESDLKHAD